VDSGDGVGTRFTIEDMEKAQRKCEEELRRLQQSDGEFSEDFRGRMLRRGVRASIIA